MRIQNYTIPIKVKFKMTDVQSEISGNVGEQENMRIKINQLKPTKK